MSYPYPGSVPVTNPNITVTVPFDTGDLSPGAHWWLQSDWQAETPPCSCGLSYRHLWLTHWFRLVFMRERW